MYKFKLIEISKYFNFLINILIVIFLITTSGLFILNKLNMSMFLYLFFLIFYICGFFFKNGFTYFIWLQLLVLLIPVIYWIFKIKFNYATFNHLYFFLVYLFIIWNSNYIYNNNYYFSTHNNEHFSFLENNSYISFYKKTYFFLNFWKPLKNHLSDMYFIDIDKLKFLLNTGYNHIYINKFNLLMSTTFKNEPSLVYSYYSFILLFYFMYIVWLFKFSYLFFKTLNNNLLNKIV